MNIFEESLLEMDHYDGVSLHVGRLEDTSNFETRLQASLEAWKADKKRGIWIHVPHSEAALIPICTAHDFEFHSVQDSQLILTRWLPESSSRLPKAADTQVGIGCVIWHPDDGSDLGSQRRLLCVQEASGPAKFYKLWKVPTGLCDPMEDVQDACVREVKEETGLDVEFEGIMCFRQAHPVPGSSRKCSDVYVVCQAKLVSSLDSLQLCDLEIADSQWMAVQDFQNQETWQKSPLYQLLNEQISHQGPLWRASRLPLRLDSGSATNTLFHP